MTRPLLADYAPHFAGYVDLVPESDILAALDAQASVVRRMAAAVPRDKELFAYAPGKWTVRQVVGHLADVERVFGYRSLSFSRFEKAPLPGFDENAYVEHGRFDEIPFAQLVDDLLAVRDANLRLLRTFREEQWAASGIANGRSMTVKAIAFVMVGHVRHHLRILEERYGMRL